jgi:DNA-binding transcriptional ArsR family regulator
MSTELLTPMQDVYTIHNIETMKVLISPLRASVLSVLIQNAYTVKEVSEKLQVPPNRLYYHINLLEQHHLIQVVETRVISGILENHYRAVAENYLVDPALLAPESSLSGQTIEILLKNVLDSARKEIIRLAHKGVINISNPPPDPQALFAQRTSLVIPPEHIERVYRKITDFLEDLRQNYSVELDDADSHAGYTLVTVFYPHPNE